MSNTKPKAVYILHDYAFESIYSDCEKQAIAELLDISDRYYTSDQILENLDILKDVECILSGWGGPRIDQTFLDAAPNLKAVFYGAGSIRGMTTPEFWNAGILITSAVAANAIPVSEFTLSQILFSLKSGWQHVHLRNQGKMNVVPVAGGFRSTVGLISMGTIAKRVRNLLRNFEINVIAYDPFMSEADAKAWDIDLVPLDELFCRSSVVSLHAPDLPETKGMIKRIHFESMLPYSTFLNTGRSGTVNHTDLCDVLASRDDLWAVIDVTEDASEEETKRMIDLHNISMTPHIAGSTGKERHRMGQYMLQEITRYVNGQALEYSITEQQSKILA